MKMQDFATIERQLSAACEKAGIEFGLDVDDLDLQTRVVWVVSIQLPPPKVEAGYFRVVYDHSRNAVRLEAGDLSGPWVAVDTSSQSLDYLVVATRCAVEGLRNFMGVASDLDSGWNRKITALCLAVHRMRIFASSLGHFNPRLEDDEFEERED